MLCRCLNSKTKHLISYPFIIFTFVFLGPQPRRRTCHGRPNPRSAMGPRNGHHPNPRSAMGPGTGAALEAFRPVPLSLEASRAPTHPPHWMLYGVGRACWEGGVRPVPPCLVFPSLLCPCGFSCFMFPVRSLI